MRLVFFVIISSDYQTERQTSNLTGGPKSGVHFTIVFTEEGVDLRISRRLDKARVLSAAIDIESLRSLLVSLTDIDKRNQEAGFAETAFRFKQLSRVGPISLSNLGQFTANNFEAYEARIASIMRSMVDSEPALAKVRVKRSGLLTAMKSVFRAERVLAKRGEDISSHRIVSQVQLHEGLVADLVLKNVKSHPKTTPFRVEKRPP